MATARKSVKGDATLNAGRRQRRGDAGGYTTLVSRYASSYGVPVSLAHAVISVESNYRPEHARQRRRGRPDADQAGDGAHDGLYRHGSGLFNPETNIKYGMKYLGLAHQLGGGTTCGTILRYNAGHAAKRMNPVSAAYCSKVKRVSWQSWLPVAERSIVTGSYGRFSVAFSAANAFIRPASRPGGRTSKSRKAAGEESPGSMETRCRITAGGGDPRESATESKPPADRPSGDGAARVKGWGKSPPRDWQQERHGKPHREQDRIGTARGATLGAVSGPPSG